MRIRPVNSSQELLRTVPGLFIGQHAGGGKAEQLFLRGFDVDHGTDIALSVEGMPVNFVSHAHGQGYADLHFIIPEAVQAIDYGKGPYDAERGNFATAGYVDFRLKDRLDESFGLLEVGQFGRRRMALGTQIVDSDRNGLYILGEALRNDGPFESPQHFRRENLLLRYKGSFAEGQTVTATLMQFSSSWDASGQIPQRAVDEGLITRFGAIDDTEGGNTSRTNLMLKHGSTLGKRSRLQTNAYASRSDFTLWSNFTFFLEDPINGDQIRQSERRTLYGLTTEYQYALGPHATDLLRVGVGLRSDRVHDVGLQSTTNRTELRSSLAQGQVTEDNLFAYTDAEFRWGAFALTTGLRVDELRFAYEDELTPQYSVQAERAAVVSPKLSASLQVSPTLALYAKAGQGYHSNDARAVAAGEVEAMVPKATGADLGLTLKPTPRSLLNVAVWALDLEQEFVYVGDAGIVEPSGKTRRAGVDVSLRHEVRPGLLADADYTYSYARARSGETESSRIPLAPVHTFQGGLSYARGAWAAGLRTRVLSDRPATEDASLTANGYALVDANTSYSWQRFTFAVRIDNALDAEWEEAQFATTSRLPGEQSAVEEIHFTPGVPRRVVGVIRIRW